MVIPSTKPLSFFAKLEIGTSAFTLPVLTTAFSALTESIFPIRSPLLSNTDTPVFTSAAVAADAAVVVVVVVVAELCAGADVPVVLSSGVVDVVDVLCVVVDCVWAGGGCVVSGVVLVVVVLVVFVGAGLCCEVVDVVCCVEVAVAG